jgi:cytidylate kinase
LRRITIAIDGPAGAGKSTIAKYISQTLGITYLDTGAMYRAVALKAIREGVDTRDREKMALLVKNICIRIDFSEGEQRVFLDNEDVSEKIRSAQVSQGASDVATIPEVRLKMVELQRAIAKGKSVVMDGRDIGTYVLPDSEIKIFLTASLEERTRRRYMEQVSKGMDVSLDEVRKGIEYRDKNDSSRDFAPLAKARDAIEIDTTHMTVEEVARKIMGFIERFQ